MADTKRIRFCIHSCGSCSEALAEYMRYLGHDVTMADTGNMILCIQGMDYDMYIVGKYSAEDKRHSPLYLLDLVRMESEERPCVFITEYSPKDLILEAFSAGADDCIEAPYDLDVITARLLAIMRRSNRIPTKVQQIYTLGDVMYDTTEASLISPRSCLKIPPRYAQILILLFEHSDSIVSIDFIRERVGTKEGILSPKKMIEYIRQIRTILNSDGGISLEGYGGDGLRLIINPFPCPNVKADAYDETKKYKKKHFLSSREQALAKNPTMESTNEDPTMESTNEDPTMESTDGDYDSEE